MYIGHSRFRLLSIGAGLSYSPGGATTTGPADGLAGRMPYRPRNSAAMSIAGLAPAGVLFGFGSFLVGTGRFYRLPMAVQPMKAVLAVMLTGGPGPGRVAASGLRLMAQAPWLGACAFRSLPPLRPRSRPAGRIRDMVPISAPLPTVSEGRGPRGEIRRPQRSAFTSSSRCGLSSGARAGAPAASSPTPTRSSERRAWITS
jgi:hypothetical protein